MVRLKGRHFHLPQSPTESETESADLTAIGLELIRELIRHIVRNLNAAGGAAPHMPHHSCAATHHASVESPPLSSVAHAGSSRLYARDQKRNGSSCCSRRARLFRRCWTCG